METGAGSAPADRRRRRTAAGANAESQEALQEPPSSAGNASAISNSTITHLQLLFLGIALGLLAPMLGQIWNLSTHSTDTELIAQVAAAAAAAVAAQHSQPLSTLPLSSPSARDVTADGGIAGPYFSVKSPHKHRVDANRLIFVADSYPLAIVSDLDHLSRDPKEFLWHSLLKLGNLRRRLRQPLPPSAASSSPSPTADADGTAAAALEPPAFSFTIEWEREVKLTSRTAMKNRSMELSELTRFHGRYYAFCDVTGLVHRIILPEGRTFLRYAVADGNGDMPRPMKIEWATVKDNLMWVGSVGMEHIDSAGQLISRTSEWVKSIDGHGRIDNLNWGPIFQSLRTATNTSYPGYLWHEAVTFDSLSRQWIFLPRKASVGLPYDEVADRRRGTNLLLIASESFDNIQVRRIGPLEPDYGFTAVRKVPGTRHIYAALKVREDASVQHTKLCVFDLDGRLYLDHGFTDIGHVKYEGLEFI